MDDGSPSVPGFRSLSQAGIRLQEGLNQGTAVAEETAHQVRTGTQDSHWPPMPTMGSGDGGSPVAKSRQAEAVVVQPREPGTKRPLPRDRGGMEGGGVPAGVYVGQLPSVRFGCPCCGAVLTIPDPASYRGEPGPCPHCTALVLPPRVVSPFAVVSPADEGEDRRRHYSGFVF